MEIINGGIELLDKIEPLWLQLNLHHSSISPYFEDDFKNFKFEDRKNALIEKANKGNLRIFLFYSDNLPEGYCIASIEGNEGEIDSIFITEKNRKKGIGTRLISNAIRWLNENGIARIKVGVVFGNDDTFRFYQKFGLFPRLTYLMTENWHSKDNL